jgi:excisionase family DNA binding protein
MEPGATKRRVYGDGEGRQANGGQSALPKLDLESILDALADRVAAKLGNQMLGGTIKPRLLSVEQASVYLGRSKEAVEHMIAAGKLPVVRADRRVFLDVKDLDRFIDENKT